MLTSKVFISPSSIVVCLILIFFAVSSDGSSARVRPRTIAHIATSTFRPEALASSPDSPQCVHCWLCPPSRLYGRRRCATTGAILLRWTGRPGRRRPQFAPRLGAWYTILLPQPVSSQFIKYRAWNPAMKVPCLTGQSCAEVRRGPPACLTLTSD